MAKRGNGLRTETPLQTAENYQHPTATAALRPEVGTQALFRKRKPPRTYHYDSSLSPSLEWDNQNTAREVGEALLQALLEAKTLEEAKAIADKLQGLSKPFLNWAGKAEHLSFDVPTLPLFIHERLSTRAILETLKGHIRDRCLSMLDLFGDPQHPIYEQVLRAYEHKDNWTNRLILGDSLVVMNSLLSYEGLGGQVQMIYIDPPYGVKFGSNFQPFVRKRDVKHNDDADMTREPEMVQAYRDTWELGLHSYLTYLRDRLLLCRELLTPSGSVFVQISDENLHHVREVMDEVFGAGNFVGIIPFLTTSSQTAEGIGSVADYLVWFAKNREQMKYRQLYLPKDPRATGGWGFNYIEGKDGIRRPLTKEERRGEVPLPANGLLYRLDT
jgi:adenine-specific DNA-methyltransferase